MTLAPLLALVLAAAPALADGPRVVIDWRDIKVYTPHLVRRLDVRGPIAFVVPLSKPIPVGTGRLVPVEGSGPALAADVFEDAGKLYLSVFADPLAPELREFAWAPDAAVSPAIALERDGDNVRVVARGKPFTAYRTDLGAKPILYPVVGPAGVAVTRAYPMADVEGEDRDHPHQRSFWVSHGNVNGLDFWASDPLNKPDPRFGTIRETAKLTVLGGATLGLLRTADAWLGPDGKPVCTDERVLRFHDLGGVRLIDLDLTIRAAAGPVTFGDTKEGMFGLRVASTMDAKRKDGGHITNAEGLTDGAAWGKAAPWVDYAGPVDGKTVGIAILNHPSSFRAPTTWHVRDYGLFAANPFGWRDFGRKEPGDHTLAAGDSMTFRYRVVLHDGPTDPAALGAWYGLYAQPPRVEVVDR